MLRRRLRFIIILSILRYFLSESRQQLMDEMEVDRVYESPSLANMNRELIQIKTADEKEVQRRIDSFIRNKRNEVDERNIREFISPFGSDPSSSCARVEAVYIHREGMKSHINLKNVENSYGPQTRLRPDGHDGRQHSMKPADVQRAEAIDERLSNMEHHLNLSDDESDIYKRIKALEERISFLEGVSPEYFTNGIPPSKNNKVRDTKKEGYKPMESLEGKDLTDINKRILQLKEILKMKS